MSLMMVATLIIRLRRWFVCTWAKCVVDHLRPVFYRPRCKLLCVCVCVCVLTHQAHEPSAVNRFFGIAAAIVDSEVCCGVPESVIA